MIGPRCGPSGRVAKAKPQLEPAPGASAVHAFGQLVRIGNTSSVPGVAAAPAIALRFVG